MAGKKGGAAASTQNEQKQTLPIRVRIDRLVHEDNNKLRAIASANIGDFAVHGIRVYENDKGLFTCMPSSSYTDSQGNKKYEDIFHPVTKEARDVLCQAILDGYQQKLSEEQSDAQSTAQNQPSSEQIQKM